MVFPGLSEGHGKSRLGMRRDVAVGYKNTGITGCPAHLCACHYNNSSSQKDKEEGTASVQNGIWNGFFGGGMAEAGKRTICDAKIRFRHDQNL